MAEAMEDPWKNLTVHEEEEASIEMGDQNLGVFTPIPLKLINILKTDVGVKNTRSKIAF